MINRCVTKANGAVFIQTIQALRNKCADRQGQVFCSGQVCKRKCIQQGMTNKGRIDNRRRIFGNKKRTRLPVKIVPPAMSPTFVIPPLLLSCRRRPVSRDTVVLPPPANLKVFLSEQDIRHFFHAYKAWHTPKEKAPILLDYNPSVQEKAAGD